MVYCTGAIPPLSPPCITKIYHGVVLNKMNNKMHCSFYLMQNVCTRHDIKPSLCKGGGTAVGGGRIVNGKTIPQSPNGASSLYTREPCNKNVGEGLAPPANKISGGCIDEENLLFNVSDLHGARHFFCAGSGRR